MVNDSNLTISQVQMYQILFNLMDSVLDNKSAIYVAGPLDSGRDFFKILADGKVSSEEVRATNQARLTEFARRLRLNLGRPVIDPGLLRVPGWSGRDYGKFFIEIINRYANEVWFINGWEFSYGATKEFINCTQYNLPCFNEVGKQLSVEMGYSLIQTAANYIEEIGLDASKLRSRLISLSNLIQE